MNEPDKSNLGGSERSGQSREFPKPKLADQFFIGATRFAMGPHIVKLNVFYLGFSILILSLSTDPASGQQPVASFFYDERGNVTRNDRDTNGDGKMDRWTYYDQT
jgi:hypothetical protein